MTSTRTEPEPASRRIGENPDKGLKAGALGLLSSVVIGVSSTAPGYGLAATLGSVVAAVALQSPAVMILAFIPMFCIADAYRELNQAEPDCGTTFTWATKAFGPRAGWLGGWGIIAADVVVMANLAQIAAIYGFLLFGADGLAESTFWTTVVWVVWIVALTWVCYRGIEVSARLQYVLLAAEAVALAVFAAFALVKVNVGGPPEGGSSPDVSWFNPFNIDSFSSLSAGVLLAVFIYWGWDTAMSVNEETADKERTPGRAAVLSTVILLGIYALVTVSCLAYAGTDRLADSDDVLAVIGDEVLGSELGKLLIIAVLTSAAASTQTTILPTARATLSMGAYRALPSSFARIHPRYLTPTVSTIAMGAASVAFYVGLTIVSGNVLADSIAALGLLIAFYYGLTGYACVWYFRRAAVHRRPGAAGEGRAAAGRGGDPHPVLLQERPGHGGRGLRRDVVRRGRRGVPARDRRAGARGAADGGVEPGGAGVLPRPDAGRASDDRGRARPGVSLGRGLGPRPASRTHLR
jgi:amino acid transporter